MVRNLLVIHISCLCDPLMISVPEYLRGKSRSRPEALQAADVFMYFLRHRGGQHPRIRSGIGNHLLLIQLLDNPQGFIRADLE